MPDHEKLPAEFSDLQDLADLFAISDDLRRSRQSGAASTADQRRWWIPSGLAWALSTSIWMATMTIHRIF